MVPKDGGNRFSFLGSWNYTGSGLSSGQLPSDLIARQVAPDNPNQNSMKKVYDYGIGVGGPIMKDRIWFYSANRWWGNQAYIAGTTSINPAITTTYVPDLNNRSTTTSTTRTSAVASPFRRQRNRNSPFPRTGRARARAG